MRTQKSKGFPSVVLLTDDAENRHRAEKEGVPCLSGEHRRLLHRKALSNAVLVHSYVSGAKDSVKLLDIVVSAGDGTLDVTGASVAKRPALYPDVRKRNRRRLLLPLIRISASPRSYRSCRCSIRYSVSRVLRC